MALASSSRRIASAASLGQVDLHHRLAGASGAWMRTPSGPMSHAAAIGAALVDGDAVLAEADLDVTDP